MRDIVTSRRRRYRSGRRPLAAVALAAVIAVPGTAWAAARLPWGLNWVVCGVFGALLLIAAAGLVVAVIQRRGAAAAARRLMAMVDTTGTAALVTGPDGAAWHATAAWTHLAPFDTAEPLKGLIGRVSGAGDGLAPVRAALSRGEIAGADLRLADGRCWHVSARPFAEAPGCTLWRAEDITGRLAGLAAPSAELAAMAADGATIGVYTLDLGGRFVTVNAAFAGWLGTTAEALTGGATAIGDLAPLPGADAFSGEVEFAGADGAFTALVAHTKVAGPGGDRVLGMIRNLTAECAEAEQRRISDERFRRLFEEAPVGTAVIDGDGRITESNAAFARIVGRDRDGLDGTEFIELVAPADRVQLQALFAAAAGTDDRQSPVEATLQGGDGEGGTVVSLFAGRQADGGGSSRLILHLLDLTEQKAVEEQLFQSQKMELIGQLAGGVAHDFNNLLTAMIGFCDLLLQRHTPKDQSFGDIMQVKQNANRAANLVRQLLAFSRQQTLQPKVLTLSDVLAELSQLLRRLIGARIELKLVHGRDLGLVCADQGQLEQVVINLAVNARDAMPDGGTLNIRTSNAAPGDRRVAAHAEIPEGDYVLIEIADTGTGIPREHLDKIYEPFFTTKEVGSGTGLGLATVYGIIKQTGGYIFVDSTEGEGTTFTIFLPRHVPDEKLEAPAAVAERELRDLTGAGRVLLVEDEDAVRLFGARALRNKGYEVIEAVNGEDALDVLNGAEQPIDLVITDVVMPGVDGPTLIRTVRETHPDLKVIFISGYAEDTFRQSVGGDTEIHFLPKPFSLLQLAGKVKEVMVEEG